MIDILNEIAIYLVRFSDLITDSHAHLEVAGIDVHMLMSPDDGKRLTFYTDRWRATMEIYNTIGAWRSQNVVKSVLYVRNEEAMLEDLTALRLAMPTEDVVG